MSSSSTETVQSPCFWYPQEVFLSTKQHETQSIDGYVRSSLRSSNGQWLCLIESGTLVVLKHRSGTTAPTTTKHRADVGEEWERIGYYVGAPLPATAQNQEWAVRLGFNGSLHFGYLWSTGYWAGIWNAVSTHARFEINTPAAASIYSSTQSKQPRLLAKISDTDGSLLVGFLSLETGTFYPVVTYRIEGQQDSKQLLLGGLVAEHKSEASLPSQIDYCIDFKEYERTKDISKLLTGCPVIPESILVELLDCLAFAPTKAIAHSAFRRCIGFLLLLQQEEEKVSPAKLLGVTRAVIFELISYLDSIEQIGDTRYTVSLLDNIRRNYGEFEFWPETPLRPQQNLEIRADFPSSKKTIRSETFQRQAVIAKTLAEAFITGNLNPAGRSVPALIVTRAHGINTSVNRDGQGGPKAGIFIAILHVLSPREIEYRLNCTKKDTDNDPNNAERKCSDTLLYSETSNTRDCTKPEPALRGANKGAMCKSKKGVSENNKQGSDSNHHNVPSIQDFPVPHGRAVIASIPLLAVRESLQTGIES